MSLIQTLDAQAKALHDTQTCVTEQRQVCEDLRVELSDALNNLSALQIAHGTQAESHSKLKLQLEEDIQAARLHISTVESNLKDALANASVAKETVLSLNEHMVSLNSQLHAGTEEAESLKSDLQAKVAEYDVLTAEHRTNTDRCQELSASLQQCEEAVQVKDAELEQAISSLDAEKAIRVCRCWFSYGSMRSLHHAHIILLP